MTRQVYSDAKLLWNYMVLGEPVVSTEMLLVLGSIDERVASYAAELTLDYDYPLVVFSGGIAHETDLLQTRWGKSEAERFYEVFVESGGRAENMLLEKAAKNTGQNARFTYELLKQHASTIPQSIQIVTKPYMERRAKATFESQWPGGYSELFVTSPQIPFEDYARSEQEFELTLNVMVGDLERIIEYPRLGYQTVQEVPPDVLDAWHRLAKSGYTKHRIVY